MERLQDAALKVQYFKLRMIGMPRFKQECHHVTFDGDLACFYRVDNGALTKVAIFRQVVELYGVSKEEFEEMA
jgi:hypothetical protein